MCLQAGAALPVVLWILVVKPVSLRTSHTGNAPKSGAAHTNGPHGLGYVPKSSPYLAVVVMSLTA